jgi:3-phosphoglycerate kinase
MEKQREDGCGLFNFVRGMSREEKVLYLANALNTTPQIFKHFEDERLAVTIISHIQRKKSRERMLARLEERQRLKGIVDTRTSISGAYRRAVQQQNGGNKVFIENVRARTALASRRLQEGLKGLKKTG